MTAPSSQPQKPSKVVPMNARPAQVPPLPSPTATSSTTVEPHPADEPGYGHGV
jgi:hypothetical protein